MSASHILPLVKLTRNSHDLMIWLHSFLALAVYEYAAGFLDEYTLAWRRRWTLATWFLVVNRYAMVISGIWSHIEPFGAKVRNMAQLCFGVYSCIYRRRTDTNILCDNPLWVLIRLQLHRYRAEYHYGHFTSSITRHCLCVAQSSAALYTTDRKFHSVFVPAHFHTLGSQLLCCGNLFGPFDRSNNH